MKYRSEIDGLRALAVVPVILFHAGFKEFSGGFVGVDVFFVISGYLITTILLSDLQAGSFSIIRFYERRARRILPALFFVMLTCFPFAWFWLLPQEMKSFSQSLVGVSVFASNILFWRTSGYFDTATDLKPLIHTWSLSVEEQYYVLFPLFLALTWRLGKRWIVCLLGVAATISLGLAEYLSTVEPSADFYLLPTRAWELLVGAFVASYYTEHNIKKHKHIYAEIGSLVGFVLISYPVLTYSNQTPFPSLYALAPTLGAALIIIFASHKTSVGKLLGSKLFVAIGLVSYSAYLWHQPLFAFARHRSLGEPSLLLMSALAGFAILLAYLSWRFIERPFRNKHRFSRGQIFSLGALFTIAFIAIGLVGYFTKGYYYRQSYADKFSRLEEAVRVNQGLSKACDDSFSSSIECHTSENPEIVVWGDSFAMHLVDGLIASNPGVKLVQDTVGDCGPFFDVAPFSLPNYGKSWALKCIATNDQVLNQLKTTPSIKYAVLSSPFSKYVGEDALLMNREGAVIQGKDEAMKYFKNTLETLKSLGITPIIFSPTPQNGNNLGACLLKSKLFDYDASKCDFSLSVTREHQKQVYEFLEQLEKSYKVVKLWDGMCSNGVCMASRDDMFIYRDYGHLTHEGSAALGKRMNFYERVVGTGASPGFSRP